MASNIKNLAIILLGIASCSAMQFNNNLNNQNNIFNNQFNNNMNNQNNFMFNNNIGMNNINMFNNNIGMNNLNVINNMINNEITNFYKNEKQKAQYVKSKINSGNNGSGIILNNNSILDSFDLKLFLYNIKHSKSALSNASRLLRQLVSKANIDDNFLQDKFKCDSKKLGTNLSFLFDYYAGEIYKKGSDLNDGNDCTLSTTLELVTMILNHYLLSAQISKNINVIQQQLQFSTQNIWADLNNKYNYNEYYCNYFLPRYNYQLQKWIQSNKNTQFVPSNDFQLKTITTEDWKNAVTLIKKIDLAGILNKVITAVNLSELQMCSVNEQTTSKPIQQIILKNCEGKCWLNSTFQLLKSAVELSSNTTKNTLDIPEQGYLFCNFVNYLKNKSATFIKKDQYGNMYDFQYNDEGGTLDSEGHYIAKQTTGLSLIDEIFKFEETLTQNIKNKWNNIPGVKDAKTQLKEIDKKYFMSGAWVGYEFLTRVFPELRNIVYFNTDDQLVKYDTKITSYIPNSNINSVVHTSYNDYISNSNNKIFIISGDGYSGTLSNQINNNKYFLSFDNKNNLHLYRLIGMQLKEGGHLTAFTKSSNTEDNWNYYDSLGKYTVWSSSISNIFENPQTFSNSLKAVVAYMFKKYF